MTDAVDKQLIEDLRNLVTEGERLLMLARSLKPSTEEQILREWAHDTDQYIRIVNARADIREIKKRVNININVNTTGRLPQ